MPELRFRIRWPNGAEESSYSPSLVVKEFFIPGESYRLADFIERSRTALTLASDRVEARYGWRCSRAAAQLARIESAAASFAATADARVTVDAFEE